jgi:hypothetical protein
MLIPFLVSCATAAALACMIAWRRPEHRATAVLLSAMFGLQVALIVLDVAVLAPLRTSLGVAVPWTGWAWGAALAGKALGLAWPAVLFGTALVVYARRPPWAAVVAWASAVVAYAWLHPVAADGGQARFQAMANMLGAVSAAAMGVAWYARRSRSDATTSAQNVLAVVVLMELLALPEIPRVGVLQSWPAPAAVYVIVMIVIALVQGGMILHRIELHEQRLAVLDKSNLKAHVVAAAAVRTAESAKEMAVEARNLADNIPAAPPPSSRRPPSTPEPRAADNAVEAPEHANGAPPSSRRCPSTSTPG